MLVSQILKDKGDLVHTVTVSRTLAEVAKLLHEKKIGAVVVLGDDGKVVGIISERDIVRALADSGREALDQTADCCMTRDVIFAAPGETVDSLLGRMTDRRIRHLPVVTNGRLSGIVSIGDLVKHKISEVEAEADGLKQYISAG